MAIFSQLSGSGSTATVEIQISQGGTCADFTVTNTSATGSISGFYFNLNSNFDSTKPELVASLVNPSTWKFEYSSKNNSDGFDHNSGGQCGKYQYLMSSTNQLGPGQTLTFRLCSTNVNKTFSDNTFLAAPDALNRPFQLAVTFQNCVAGRFMYRPTPTTVAPTTTKAATTTVAPTTTKAATTTVAPTTTKAATTTVAPTTTKAATTTVAPTTTKAATTTVAPTTTKAATTTVAPTTTAAPRCPVANPQTCCQIVVEFKTQLVPPALDLGDNTIRNIKVEVVGPTIESVCPEKVIICGKVRKTFEYTAVSENGTQTTKTITDERPFQCVIDRDDANAGDQFAVVGSAVLCQGAPRVQNSASRPGPNNDREHPVKVFWKVLEKDIIKVCIRKVTMG